MSSASSFTVTITSAADDQEATYLSRARLLHRTRIGIAAMLLGASAGVVGTESAPLHYYNDTKSYSSMFLPLWPLNLDVRQTNALLACGAVILFQAIVYIGVAAFPSVRPNPLPYRIRSMLLIMETAPSPPPPAKPPLLSSRRNRPLSRHRRRRVLHLPPLRHLPRRFHRQRNHPQLDLQMAIRRK